jgi:hypothetical protein
VVVSLFVFDVSPNAEHARRALTTPEEGQGSVLSFPFPLFHEQRGAFPGKVFTNSTIVDGLLACYLTMWYGEPCHEVRNPYRKSYTLRIPWGEPIFGEATRS